MKYFLIAGEASGDLHASNLMKGLKSSDPAASFRFIGGDLMEEVAAGGLQEHYRKMNYMGFVKVILNLRRLSKILRKTQKEIRTFAPDAVILVDYAGFNLRIAKFAHSRGFRVYYFIPPKVWAWKKGRLRALRKYVTRIFCIFPFEVPFYREQGMEVEFHGNPLADATEDYREKHAKPDFRKKHGLDERPIVALLAGSRRQELKLILPVLRKVADACPEQQFLLAGAPSCEPDLYLKSLEGSDVKLLFGATYDILDHASAGIITSGTATLEAALFNVPQVVIYKIGALTYIIGRLFVKFRFFGLVNLILDREAVKEFLQKDLYEDVMEELTRLLHDVEHRQNILNAYEEIRKSIGSPGASRRAAERMIELIRDSK